MNFEDFRSDLETKLKLIVEFELIEFHYLQYCFGNGTLAYRIKGRIHKFIFDGRDNSLTWLISKNHQKYSDVKLTEYCRFSGLIINEEELLKGIKNGAQNAV